MPERQTLVVSGGRAGFEQAAANLGAILDACGASGRGRFHAELVFEEVVTNVIRYAYHDNAARQIEVELACDAETIEFAFSDDGPAFDPLTRPDPVKPKSLEDAHEGGLGIFLVRRVATRVGYERIGGRNRLLVTIAAR